MFSASMSVMGISSVLSTFDEILEFAGNGSTTYVVGTNVHYAPYQEFGTSQMRANPFLRPAANEVRGNIPQYLKRANGFSNAIKLAALDLERRAKQKAPVDTGNLKNSIRTVEQ